MPRRSLHLLVAVLVLVFGMAPAAQAADDPTAKRDEVRRKRAQVASGVDALRASDAELEAAVAALRDDVESQEARLGTARQLAEVAEAKLRETEQRQRTKAAEAATIRRDLVQAAVAAYVRPPTDELSTALSARSLDEAAQRRQFLNVHVGRRAELQDRLRALREDIEVERKLEARTRDLAAARRAEAQKRLRSYETALARQEAVAAGLDQRLEASLAEAASLATVDRDLSAEIERRNAQYAQFLRAAAARKAANARAAATSSRPPARTGSVSRPVATGGGMVNVRGIVVAGSIAGRLDAMLAAASAAGIQLAGSGYRNSSGQIAARRSNCGSSDYAIYQMPASQCRPPTARPGSSMHEQGLAVDFTSGGRTLRRGDAAFGWLQGNAGRFGFYNLPSEPWHWSVNGN